MVIGNTFTVIKKECSGKLLYVIIVDLMFSMFGHEWEQGNRDRNEEK